MPVYPPASVPYIFGRFQRIVRNEHRSIESRGIRRSGERPRWSRPKRFHASATTPFMGSPATIPTDAERDGEPPEDDGPNLGDLLSGRLGDIDIDSVEAVRDVRERR